jgi:hypothetical protein
MLGYFEYGNNHPAEFLPPLDFGRQIFSFIKKKESGLF